MTTLLLVEDDAQLAKSLDQGFRENGFTVVIADTLKAALGRLKNGSLDVVVLDLGLPDGNGLELIRSIKSGCPYLPVIITTARGELDHRLRGLDAGADDYLVKPYAFAELLARLRAVLRRIPWRNPEIWRVGDLEVDTLSRRVVRANQVLDLTPREYDLLMRLVRAQGEVVTRDMLAQEVWRQQAWTPSLDNSL